MQIRYFAWVRQRTGISTEELTPPEGVRTIADMIAWLKTRGPEFEAAFENERIIRAALDQTHVAHDADITGAREVAFFPPVTGG
ncbi:MAG: molybdopterin converting factor subunit 1 [Hyphomicrobiales bacterium]|nr:MAG: molybdopterin converting factor subunit 1 [Hyphomicrobiales bacterium]